jgi:hypothetical protein
MSYFFAGVIATLFLWPCIMIVVNRIRNWIIDLADELVRYYVMKGEPQEFGTKLYEIPAGTLTAGTMYSIEFVGSVPKSGMVKITPEKPRKRRKPMTPAQRRLRSQIALKQPRNGNRFGSKKRA